MHVTTLTGPERPGNSGDPEPVLDGRAPVDNALVYVFVILPHHADPTCARHGQIDMSARPTRLFEVAGWATQVRWPTPTASPASRPQKPRS